MTTATEPSPIVAGIRQSEIPAPAWYKALQIEALQEFQVEPFPARGDESWRFSSLKNLALEDYFSAPAFEGDIPNIPEPRDYSAPSGRIIFADYIVVRRELVAW